MKEWRWQGQEAPLPVLTFLPLHVVEHPVPDDHEAGDDDVGEESSAEECSDNDEFGVHCFSPHASAATLSAQVSTFVLIASSSYEVRLIWSRPNVIM